MNQRTFRLIVSSISVILLFAACQTENQSYIPITGSNNDAASMPARVSLVRGNVLEYIVESRFANIPEDVDWELQDGNQAENQFRFRSGDWLMVIRAADSDEQDQRVIIINKVEGFSWSGYYTADGRVVDTAYGR